MKRRLFNLATATSLLLCLGCVGLWLRSEFAEDVIKRDTSDGSCITITSSAGLISLNIETWYVADEIPGPFLWSWQSGPNSRTRHPPLSDLSFGSWGYEAMRLWTRPGGGCAEYVEYVTAYWLPALLSAVLPSLWLWRRHKQEQATTNITTITALDVK